MLNTQVNHAVPAVSYASLYMETMGDRIRRLRVARNYTQEEFGKLVGITKSAVSQWEDGSTKNPRLAPFLKMIEVLHTDANYLVYGERRAPASAPGAALPGVRKGT